MKTFEVELKRVSYVTRLVDAESKEQAEDWALEEVFDRMNNGTNDADWSIESVEEVSS